MKKIIKYVGIALLIITASCSFHGRNNIEIDKDKKIYYKVGKPAPDAVTLYIKLDEFSNTNYYYMKTLKSEVFTNQPAEFIITPWLIE